MAAARQDVSSSHRTQVAILSPWRAILIQALNSQALNSAGRRTSAEEELKVDGLRGWPRLGLVLQRRVMRKHAQVFFFSYEPFIMGDSHSFVASFKIRATSYLVGQRVGVVLGAGAEKEQPL